MMVPPQTMQQQQQQQQQDAPPAFDMLGEAFDMKPPASYSQQQQHHSSSAPPYVAAPPAPSAPAFEDLLGGMEQMSPPMPMPTMEETQSRQYQHQNQNPPPPSSEAELAAEFAGLGLSEEEIKEQIRIMKEMEQNKSNRVATAADAFDLRSNAAVARIAGGDRVKLPSATGSSSNKQTSSSSTATAAERTIKVGGNEEVALHGQERTHAAIKDGTAILTQCVNCNNWMQVTDNASLMFCPVCQVVSPVDRENAVMTKEEAIQLEADRKMAEELQKEEYTAAERQEARQKRVQQARREAAAAAKEQDDSWWGWLGLGGSSTTPAAPATRGGSTSMASALSGATTLSPARTGSHDDAEDRRLLGHGGGGGRARVAEAKPLFACVADSISTAASSVATAMNTTTDEEGNVNGVDGSSLLVMSNAGRNQQHGQR